MAFGKPGWPTEDRLARQREIYEAVSPLILHEGARRLSMRGAARAAAMSIGGLYHYFPTKRELVLHGIQPEAIARYCQDFHDRVGYEVNFDAPGYAEAYMDFLSRAVEFIRPAFSAALELRVESLETTLEPTLRAASDEFAATFRSTFLDVDEKQVYEVARALHRTVTGALLDKHITPEEFRGQIAALINGYRVLQQSPAPSLEQAPVHYSPSKAGS